MLILHLLDRATHSTNLIILHLMLHFLRQLDLLHHIWLQLDLQSPELGLLSLPEDLALVELTHLRTAHLETPDPPLVPGSGSHAFLALLQVQNMLLVLQNSLVREKGGVARREHQAEKVQVHFFFQILFREFFVCYLEEVTVVYQIVLYLLI